MASTSVSSTNPFRTPAATPTPTGASNPAPSAADLDDAEPPPAYTPGPDVYQGEATIEHGPNRPFQPPPPRPAQPQHRPAPSQHQPPSHPPPSMQSRSAPSLLRQLAMELLGPSLQSSGRPGYPGQQQQYQQGQQQPPSLPPRPVSSDFARDFYAAGSGSGSSSSATPGPSSAPSSPTDARPTQSPTPGHPLLRDGRLLVYPKGFVCDKCTSPAPILRACAPTDARGRR